jgi:hypothetical protein
MGPTGPYHHETEVDAIPGFPIIAQRYHASFTTPALATVRQLWEVSTAFPFFWFPVEFGEAQAAIDEHYYGTEGDDTPSRFVAFCQTWMGGGGGGTEVAGTEAAGSGGGGIGGREEGKKETAKKTEHKEQHAEEEEPGKEEDQAMKASAQQATVLPISG